MLAFAGVYRPRRIAPLSHSRAPVFRRLAGLENLLLIEPLHYVTFVDLMRRATVLLTDSIFNSTEGFSSGNSFYSVNPAARWRSFPSRHDRAGGILNFTDGHAAYFKQSKIKNQQADGNEPLLPDVIWNPPYRALNP